MERLSRLLAPDPRIRVARPGESDPDGRCVLYWMQRAQRGIDNPALNLAIELGNALKLPVLTIFGLTADYPSAQRRHYRFLLEGMRDAAADLTRRPIGLASGRRASVSKDTVPSRSPPTIPSTRREAR